MGEIENSAMPSRVQILIVTAAALSGLAAVPWVVAAAGGAAVFALEFIDVADREHVLSLPATLFAVATTALVGAGHSCIFWGAGRAFSLLVSS